LIISRGRKYSARLKNKAMGQLIKPTIIGWLFGMYALGIVCTAYMFGLTWYYSVIPAFATFLPAIIIVFRAMTSWERESVTIADYYNDLEGLVSKKTAELELAYKKMLAHEKEIQKLKDQFVFIAAHELRTPVTSINWWMELTMDNMKDKLSPEALEYLTSIKSSNDKLISLVDDLLNVARLESGTIRIDPKECELKSLIIETIKDLKPTIDAKKILVSFDYPEVINMFSDPTRIKQILINLLTNATKYNKEEGVININLITFPEQVQIDIRDTGIGIKIEDMGILFTKFGRIRSSDTEKIEGTGLGLFVTKEIVGKLGGEIWAVSEYGKGSTFSVKLPLRIQPQKAVEEKAVEEKVGEEKV
jgi:signal transduction histidine kinase